MISSLSVSLPRSLFLLAQMVCPKQGIIGIIIIIYLFLALCVQRKRLLTMIPEPIPRKKLVTNQKKLFGVSYVGSSAVLTTKITQTNLKTNEWKSETNDYLIFISTMEVNGMGHIEHRATSMHWNVIVDHFCPHHYHRFALLCPFQTPFTYIDCCISYQRMKGVVHIYYYYYLYINSFTFEPNARITMQITQLLLNR